MYSNWISITERDLIQKGASYNRIRKNLKIEKIVLNMTLPNVGSSIPSSSTKSTQQNKSKLDKDKNAWKATQSSDRESVLNLSVMALLAVISGQRPILTKARQSIANWKIRKNQVLGFKVTLRGKVALDFLDKTVRFQNLNEQDVFMKPSSSNELGSSSLVNFDESGHLNLQSLGNLSIGIKNINYYPELEDLWIAQNLGLSKSDGDSNSGKTGSHRFLGLDLSLNFQNSKEISQIINSIKLKPGGKKLIENYSKNINAFPIHIKTNKSVLSLRNLLILRKLYLTSLGIFPKFG